MLIFLSPVIRKSCQLHTKASLKMINRELIISIRVLASAMENAPISHTCIKWLRILVQEHMIVHLNLQREVRLRESALL